MHPARMKAPAFLSVIVCLCRQFNRESGESACLDELDRIRRCASKSAPTNKRYLNWKIIVNENTLRFGNCFIHLVSLCDAARLPKTPLWIMSGSYFACQLGLGRRPTATTCAHSAFFVQVCWKEPKLRRGVFRSRMLGQSGREKLMNQGRLHGQARDFRILRSKQFTIRILVAQFP